MAYSIRLPDGTIVQNIPDELSFEDAKAQLIKRMPELAPAKPAGFSAADTGIAALQGVVGAGKSVADFFGAGNAASEYLDEKQKALQSAISPERQAEMARRRALEEQAAKSGKGEFSAYLGGVTEAPFQSLAQGLGSAAPALIAAGATLVAGAPAALVGAVGFATKYLLGAIQGAGEVKGSIYDATYKALRKQGKSEEDAKRQAIEAQSYIGKNTDNILVGTGLGVLAGGAGLEKALFKGVGKQAAKETEKGLLRRGLTEGAKEALPEGLQGGQEQFAQNVALSREGFETPAFQGVLGSAARDAAVGAMTGAAISPLTRQKTPEAAVPPGTPGAPTPIEQAQLDKAAAEAAAQAKAEAAAQAKLDKAAAKATKKEAEEQAKIDAANAAVPKGGNLDIFGAPPEGKRATKQTDLFGNPVVPTAVEPVEEAGEPTFVATAGPTLTPEEQAAKDAALAEQKAAGKVAKAAQNPTAEEQGAQQAIPGLETFPVSHLINQGVPKNSTMVRAYAAEGINAVDLSDPKAVETLIGRLSGWIKASKGNPKPEIQNAVKEFSNILPMLRQHLESLPTTKEAPSVEPTVESPSGTGVSVAGEPSTETTPGGTGTVDTSGVVSTEPNVGEPATGEGQQPPTVTPPAAPPAAPPAPPAPPTAPAKPQPKSNIEIDLDAARGSKAKSAPIRAKTPGYYPPEMLAPLKRLIELADTGNVDAKNAYEENFSQKEVDAARAYKPPAPTPLKFKDLLSAGKIREALQSIANNPKTPRLTQLVAQRLIQSNTLPTVEVITPAAMEKLRGKPNVLGVHYGDTDKIYIRDDSTDAHTVVHEVMHGFLARAIDEYTLMGSSSKFPEIKRIRVLYEFLKANHPGVGKSGAPGRYAMTNLHEFASEATSNKEFQKVLKAIPYKNTGTSVFSEFAKAVLRALGITDKNPSWNALAEALISIEDVLDAGRAYQDVQTKVPQAGASPLEESASELISSPGNIAAAQQTNIVNLNGPASTLQNAQQAIKGGSAEKVRVAIADRLAALDKKLFQGYGGKIRDAFGNINPSVLLAQALDFLRVGENSLLLGGLGKTTDQLYAATNLTVNPDGTGGPANMREIYRIITADAKANKETFNETLRAIGTMLIGHREYALRAYNALPTTTDPIILKLKDAQIDDLEARFQASPEAKKILAIMDAMRFNRIDMMVDAGRISPDKAQMWKDNTAYVPYDSMDAALKEVMTKGTGAAKGLAGVAAYRKLGGSTIQVGDPVKAFMDQMIRMTGDAMRVNAVSKSLRDLTLLGHAKRAYAPAQNSAEAKHRVSTYINGVKVEYHVDDPLDVAAYAGMPTEVPDILQAMQKFTQTLRAGVTLMPGFALSQLIQDTVRAYAFSEVMNPAALIPRTLMNFPRIAFGELTGMKTKVVKEMERLGIVGNYDTTTHTTIKNILLEQGVEKRGIIGSILHFGESLSKASDLAVRQAIYEQTLKETTSPQRPTGDQALAETRAREIINFSRRGDNNTLNFLTRTVPFMGAYTRGLDKLYTAATGGTNAYGLTTKEARNLFIKRMGTLTAMGLAYALMMAGDEGYEEQPDYVRDGNILMPGSKKLGFLAGLPMPKDLGFVFLAIPQRIVQYIRKNGTPEEQTGVRVIGELMRQGLATIASPNITPVAIRPMLENLVNYSFFMDRPLESQAQTQMESFERFGTGTSETAKTLSKGAWDLSQSLQNMGFSKNIAGIVEISPIKLENLFRGILGTTAEMTTAMSDMMINPTRTDRPLHKSIAAMVTGATAIIKDPVGRRQLNDLYDLSNETKMAKTTFDRLEKDDPVAADEYARTHYAEIQMNDYVAGLMKDINDLRNDAHMIDISKDIPSDERQRITSEITRQQNMIAHDVYVLRAAMGKERRMLNP